MIIARLALATIAARRVSFAGAFAALAAGVAIVTAMLLALAAPPGGRTTYCARSLVAAW